jgi:hypothetical protein
MDLDNSPVYSSSISLLWIITIKAGCFLRILYVKGIIITMAAGGAFSDNRERRFINEARRVAGRWLEKRCDIRNGKCPINDVR